MATGLTIITDAIFKQIQNLTLLIVFVLFFSCREQNKTESVKEVVSQPAIPDKEVIDTFFKANRATEIGRNINGIFQDSYNNFWFSTNGDGVFRYNKKTLLQFTKKDGLFSDYVGSIQEDKSGNIWFDNGGAVCRFDGHKFTAFTINDSLPLNGSSENSWKIVPIAIGSGDLWFNAGGGPYRYDGKAFSYLPLPKTDFDSKYSQGPSNRLSPYGLYSILKDRNGNVWFGTQAMGVCRYDGKSFTWFSEKGLSPPAVRGLFEDRNGNLWFGNNGAGLFRYDGKMLTNFTEEKGLSNPEFWSKSKISGKPRPGTLARVWTINEDDSGVLWIGTADAGAWRYDGNNLTNYTIAHGLTSNAINIIYKDKKGELWFGTDGGGVCKFNGTNFTKATFN